MGFEQIGLQAIFEDKNFQAGIKRYQDGINTASSATDRGASIMSRLGSVASGALVVGIGSATAALGAFVTISKVGIDATMKWGEQLDTLGDRFGMSGEQASAFTFLANKVGLSVDEMSLGLNSLTNGLQGIEDRIKSGSKTLSPFEVALGKIGVSAFNAKGKLKKFDELLPELMDAFSKLPPGIKASAVAMDLFGTRGGSKFLDFLRKGSAGLVDATKKAKAYGLELKTKEVDAIEAFGQSQNELGLVVLGVWNRIGTRALPYAQRFVDILTEVFGLIGQGIQGDWSPLYQFVDRVFGRETANNIGNFILRLQSVKGEIDKLATTLKTKGLGEMLKTWGTDVWDWLTNPKTGAIADAGKEVQKIANAVRDNAPAWGKVLESWKTNFWNWLTDPNTGAIITFGNALRDFSAQLVQKVSSGEGRADIENVGTSISTVIIDALTAGLTDGQKQTPMLIAFAESLGETFLNLDIALDIIGTSFQRGLAIGVYRKMGLTDAQARAIAEKAFPFNLQTQLYLVGQQAGGKMSSGFGPGVINAMPRNQGAISGAMGSVIVGASRGASVSAYSAGGAVGNSFGSGVVAAMLAQKAAILARALEIINAIRSILPSVGNMPSFQSGGIMPYTGVAYLHKGERIIPAPNVSSTRILNFNPVHNWPASVPASARGWTEQMVRTVTQQEVRSILDKV